MESSICPEVISILVTGEGQRLEPGEWMPLFTEEQPTLGAGEGWPSEYREDVDDSDTRCGFTLWADITLPGDRTLPGERTIPGDRTLSGDRMF